jgi:signal transduction histidine kinase
MELQKIGAWLNKSAFPRAIAGFDRQRFLFWNAAFLERTGYSEGRIKLIRPEEIIIAGAIRFPLPSGSGRPVAEFVACAVRTTLQPAAVPGYIVKSFGSLGYVMLHDTESLAQAEFEEARLVGQAEERARIVQMFHDEVSSTMLAALFAIETAKNELEKEHLPQTEAVARASELLSEAVEKIGDILESKKDDPHERPNRDQRSRDAETPETPG